ncbi:hypothetical protein MRX96_016072 [Rhipicephalus microplus]
MVKRTAGACSICVSARVLYLVKLLACGYSGSTECTLLQFPEVRCANPGENDSHSQLGYGTSKFFQAGKFWLGIENVSDLEKFLGSIIQQGMEIFPAGNEKIFQVPYSSGE